MPPVLGTNQPGAPSRAPSDPPPRGSPPPGPSSSSAPRRRPLDHVGSSGFRSAKDAHVLELRTSDTRKTGAWGQVRSSCGVSSSRAPPSQLLRVVFDEVPASQGVFVGTFFARSAWAMTSLSMLQEEATLGPAMRFVLAVGRARTLCAALSPEWKRLTELWDLAEQHHPEEAWWTSTYLGGARSLAELCARAPKNALASPVAGLAGLSDRRPARISSSAIAIAA